MQQSVYPIGLKLLQNQNNADENFFFARKDEISNLIPAGGGDVGGGGDGDLRGNYMKTRSQQATIRPHRKGIDVDGNGANQEAIMSNQMPKLEIRLEINAPAA